MNTSLPAPAAAASAASQHWCRAPQEDSDEFLSTDPPLLGRPAVVFHTDTTYGSGLDRMREMAAALVEAVCLLLREGASTFCLCGSCSHT